MCNSFDGTDCRSLKSMNERMILDMYIINGAVQYVYVNNPKKNCNQICKPCHTSVINHTN